MLAGVLDAARQRILRTLPDDAQVLDVGGWAIPFPRADWVLDLEQYDTRGAYGYEEDPADERFSAETWVARDICDREPWPFLDDQFDFVVCSQTLEDVRDPIFVCAELVRVGRAGYLEVPSRLAEQSWGVQGTWVGWGHHHWLIDVDQSAGSIQFVMKPHMLCRSDVRVALAGDRVAALTEEESNQSLWWEGAFSFSERFIFDPTEHLDYLRSILPPEAPSPASSPPAERRSTWRRAAGRVRRRMTRD